MELTPLGVYLSENLENITEHYPYANIALYVVMPNHWHAIVYIDSKKTPYPRRTQQQMTENKVDDGVTDGILAETNRGGGDDGFVNFDDIVETRRATSLHHAMSLQNLQNPHNNPQPENTPDTKNKQMQDLAHQQGWLSVAIGGVKSAITKFANHNQLVFAWQVRFHDHLIRDEGELNRITFYIDNNVALWDDDCFNE